MPSPIHVTEKTVNNRSVISFRKEYADEEHEVFCPKEQGTQVLLSLLSVLNEEKTDGDEFVLVRKSDVGRLEETEIVGNGSDSRKQALAEVTKALFDDQTSADVLLAVENGAEMATDGGRHE